MKSKKLKLKLIGAVALIILTVGHVLPEGQPKVAGRGIPSAPTPYIALPANPWGSGDNHSMDALRMGLQALSPHG